MLRKLIKIDESLCDGCGVCIPSCPEGALKIVDGKARLVRESFCDGLGACLNDCPRGALSVIDAETERYDELGVIDYLKANSPEKLELHQKHLNSAGGTGTDASARHHHGSGGCPSTRTMMIERTADGGGPVTTESRLRQWPIQFHLVSPGAPYFKNADIALVADCVPFAFAQFHEEILSKHPIAVGCPKLDDLSSYYDKLLSIIKESGPRSIRVLIMEVPCCSGLLQIAREAVAQSGARIPVEVTVIGIKGNVISTRQFIN